MSLGQLTSDVFLSCTPTTVAVGTTVLVGISQRPKPTTFTTEYCFTAPAAEWTATYTIREVCTGDPATWSRPSIPPNFIKTVVTCDVCEHKTQTITCPVEQAIQTGSVRIHGNGVTATPALAAATATVAAMSDAATAGSGFTPGNGVSGFQSAAAAALGGSSSDYESGSPGFKLGSPAAAAAAIVGSNSFSGTGSSGTNSSSDPAIAAAGLDSVSESSLPGANSASAAAVSAVIGSSSSSDSGSSGSNLGLGFVGMSATVTMPESSTDTEAASSTYDTADAPSLKNSLVLVSTAIVLALVASQFLL